MWFKFYLIYLHMFRLSIPFATALLLLQQQQAAALPFLFGVFFSSSHWLMVILLMRPRDSPCWFTFCFTFFISSMRFQARLEQAATTLAMYEKLTASHYWMYAMQKAQDPNDKEFQESALRLVTDFSRGPRIANTSRDDPQHPVMYTKHLIHFCMCMCVCVFMCALCVNSATNQISNLSKQNPTTGRMQQHFFMFIFCLFFFFSFPLLIHTHTHTHTYTYTHTRSLILSLSLSFFLSLTLRLFTIVVAYLQSKMKYKALVCGFEVPLLAGIFGAPDNFLRILTELDETEEESPEQSLLVQTQVDSCVGECVYVCQISFADLSSSCRSARTAYTVRPDIASVRLV
jgi:hypothetical protein